MKGLICYYSGSGNTKLACEYITSRVKMDFDFCDITKEIPEIGDYNVIGFATFTDYLGVPKIMMDFINSLHQQEKYAFLFNTYGSISGRTLRILNKLVSKKGFTVVAGHSLHTPENYPPMIAKGMAFENAPNEKELNQFNDFIEEFDKKLSQLESENVSKQRIHIGFLNWLIPTLSRRHSKKKMGEQFVDENCTECGMCETVCPYDAIKLDPKPVFDQVKCYGCWACYNHCPEKAIHTKQHSRKAYYPKPNEQLREKLKV